ncbi:MAG TPA: hypothetical protein P5244_16630 [Syntrophales bacterium]|nr:hypothetical protein [Syntrophales bacterium]
MGTLERPAAEDNDQARVQLPEEKNAIYDELQVIAGILDMLFLIDAADAWHMRSENVGMVIIDARNRTLEVANKIFEKWPAQI